MNKETIRPLLVEAAEKATLEETLAYRAIRQRGHYPELLWPELSKMEEEWKIARLKRAQAELQLWLADRQWEREEAQAHLLNSEIALRTTKP